MMEASQWQLWERWDLVAISVVVHLAVLGLFLASAAVPRRRLVNRPNGMLAAFFVALYAEMYGVPLTLYMLQPVLPGRLGLIDYPPPLALRLVGSGLILVGFYLVFLGWRRVHRSGGRLVQDGLYGRLRHPQYLGLAVLTLGQLVQWPTVAGLALWPLVVLLYRRVARMEEADLVAAHGLEAERYIAAVPGFLPRLSRGATRQDVTTVVKPLGKESTRR
jgi:methanethiol S-methyltransferase